MDQYEGICAAIAMLDAAHEIMDGSGLDCDDDMRDLTRIRNRLNDQRVAIIKSISGKAKVYSVDELPRAQKGASDD